MMHDPTLAVPMTKQAHRSDDPRLGALIAERYDVKSRLGGGGMGVVYLAHDTVLGRMVAIKTINEAPMGEHGDMLRERFRLEGRSAGRVNHPNTVKVYDMGTEDDGTPFLVMEYIEGETLDTMLGTHAQRRLPVEEAMRIAAYLLEGLVDVHEAGIVHRDLKPGNILLSDKTGQPVICDFGIGKLVFGNGTDSTASPLTVEGNVIGTARYMSPEQIDGRMTVDHRADIYAVGVLMYEMLTGKVPYEGNDVVAVAKAHVAAQYKPVPPSKLLPRRALPAGLEAVVLKALSGAPEQRFQSAEEMLQALCDISLKPRRSWVGWVSAASMLVLAGGVFGLSQSKVFDATAQETPTIKVTEPIVLGVRAPETPPAETRTERKSYTDTEHNQRLGVFQRLYDEGKYGEAAESAKLHVSYRATSQEGWYVLGMSLHHMGHDRIGAKNALKTYLGLGPGNGRKVAEVRDALARLK